MKKKELKNLLELLIESANSKFETIYAIENPEISKYMPITIEDDKEKIENLIHDLDDCQFKIELEDILEIKTGQQLSRLDSFISLDYIEEKRREKLTKKRKEKKSV
jgi:hypothetical protein